MKAVILSAGQGKRLLPLTADNPKCLVKIDGQSLIEWQINELARCGVDRASIVVGYHADRVKQLLHRRYDSQRIRTVYNPTYSWTDNLFSCWAARAEMTEDFVLLNGDTLFEAAVLNRLLETPDRPVTVVTHKKRHYDADDMKVTLDDDRLIHIGKDLSIDKVHGESIGMILFRGEGPAIFSRTVESALRDPLAQKKWYLSVIDELAQLMPVWTYRVKGSNGVKSIFLLILNMHKGSYEHVPPMVKLGRFRKPDLHGAESLRKSEVSMCQRRRPEERPV